ncbi:MAG: helix-turn-helix domain-containing protein [Pirellulaceae bacterium]
MKKLGDRVRQLRQAKGLGQRALAKMVGISLTYVSKIENHRLDFGEFPSTDVILRIAAALEANEDELLILAKKIPERIQQRVLQRPEAFSRLAELDDQELDRVIKGIMQ